jgi:hypothetical protein
VEAWPQHHRDGSRSRQEESPNLRQDIIQQANYQAQAETRAQQAQFQLQREMQVQREKILAQQYAGRIPGQSPVALPQPPQQGISHPQNMAPFQDEFQTSMQQNKHIQQNKQPQVQQNAPGKKPPVAHQMPEQDSAPLRTLIDQLMDQASEEEKTTIRASLKSRMGPPQWQWYEAQGLDPLYLYYRDQAMHRLSAENFQKAQFSEQTRISGGVAIQRQLSEANLMTP